MKSVGGAIRDLAINASKFRDVQTAFKNMAEAQGKDAKQMLANMRELSGGTVSDMKLMQEANNALLLGLPVDRFGDMLSIARSSAKATGQSMEFMLSSIVTGLGRGSKLMLDNLGIIIDTNKAYDEYARTLDKTADSLTDAEKKQAFINKALEIGQKNAEAAGGTTESLSDRWDKMNARMANLAITLGQFLGPAFAVFLDIVDDVMTGIDNAMRNSLVNDFIVFTTQSLISLQMAFVTLGKQASAAVE